MVPAPPPNAAIPQPPPAPIIAHAAIDGSRPGSVASLPSPIMSAAGPIIMPDGLISPTGQPLVLPTTAAGVVPAAMPPGLSPMSPVIGAFAPTIPPMPVIGIDEYRLKDIVRKQM